MNVDILVILILVAVTAAVLLVAQAYYVWLPNRRIDKVIAEYNRLERRRHR
jgi:hypothetical protein